MATGAADSGAARLAGIDAARLRPIVEAALAEPGAAGAEAPASDPGWAVAADGSGSLRAVVHLGSVPSTQDVATSLLRHADVDGLAVVADFQTSGRGRSGHAWDSPPAGSGLLVTLVMTVPAPRSGTVLALTQHMASLAAVRAAAAWPAVSAAESGAEAPRLAVKWPNDIYVVDPPSDGAAAHPRGSLAAHVGRNLRKAGGILCSASQSLRSPGSMHLCVGLGLNVTAAPGGRGAACEAVRVPAGSDPRPALVRRFADEMAGLWTETAGAGGPGPWRDEYEATWLHGGQRVTLADGSAATVTGLAAGGGLEAAAADGAALSLAAGDGADLMHGLVRQGKR